MCVVILFEIHMCAETEVKIIFNIELYILIQITYIRPHTSDKFVRRLRSLMRVISMEY